MLELSTFFAVQPFNDGDKVYVEGIVKNSAHGTGFNSKDYGFKFFVSIIIQMV